MDYSDYVHLVRTHEQASQDDPRAYRRRVLGFALLGYAAVFLLALLALGVLAWIGWMAAQDRLRGWMFWPALASLGLLWATLVGMRVPFTEPEGQRLAAGDAPELFAGLDRIRSKVKGPALHAVIINGDFNAAIVQQPQWLGLAHRNYLIIGWPLLAALEPRRLYAVIAHEYGHLRGDHGKLSAWIYRSRRAWSALSERYRESESVVSLALAGFVRWYFPRFDALSFALARQDEYEADRVSARLFGADVAGQTLQEVAVKGRLYAEDFWRLWWRLARLENGRPAPHAQMANALQHVVKPERVQQGLRQELRQLPDLNDTHPVLKDRLAALGQSSGLGELSGSSSLNLLGSARSRIGAALDAQWWQGAKQDWAKHGERLRALHADLKVFRARSSVGEELSVEELLRWAEAMEALSDTDPSPLLELALQQAPQHERVLLWLTRLHAPLGQGEARVGAWLDQLYQQHPQHAWRAASLAQQWLDACTAAGQVPPAELRRLWRERLNGSEQREKQSWERFAATPCWERPLPVQLDEPVLRELRGLLLRERDVRGAWLGCQDIITVQPIRPHYTLWLQCRPGLGQAAGEALAQQIYEAMELPGRYRVVVLGLHVEKDKLEQASQLLPLVQRR
ncbi:M48 family metalloprotease [Roseateles sp. DAIF2]|uniref:M48 family metallopeptidase n=1 Tax=Roseateles sp. DAIF2 TaxID=2714952 RepID=UPI0018A2559F|nr:M48 family metallopeptidase [Roseateles sp. DAIF2]QPF72792.1 M48 family metalloprotease [Roseateles sp. DAIF2]